MRSAIRPHRREGQFFLDPTEVAHRRYEALRAYFVEGAPAAAVADRFGYTESTVATLVRDFRAGDRAFFLDRRPGPRIAPAKAAAREEVLRLRAAGHSVPEIAAALAAGPTALNPTGVWEILRDEGQGRLPIRPPHERVGPMRDHPPRVRRMAWPDRPLSAKTSFAGTLLLVPGLVALDIAGAVRRARLPGTREVPALSSVLSLLGLKAAAHRRTSHVDDVATDPGLAAFAGLHTLPKATALGTYSYRLDRRANERLLSALAESMTRTGQAAGQDFDLDFHAIMHH